MLHISSIGTLNTQTHRVHLPIRSYNRTCDSNNRSSHIGCILLRSLDKYARKSCIYTYNTHRNWIHTRDTCASWLYRKQDHIRHIHYTDNLDLPTSGIDSILAFIYPAHPPRVILTRSYFSSDLAAIPPFSRG